MDSFKRFQKINGRDNRAAQMRVNSRFVINGYPTTDITDWTRTLKAAVVNKEDKDEALIFTLLDEPLEIGSMWQAKALHLLVDKEYTIIKDVTWHKYHCLICNVEIDNTWGYFVGPEKTYINVTLKQDVVLHSQQKPILVLPGQPLQYGDKIMIKDRAWLVQESDSISTDGITYYSLCPTTMSKEVIQEHFGEEVYVEPAENHSLYVNAAPVELADNVKAITANMSITETTINGYFKSSNKNIKVEKHTVDTVVFTIPNGIDEVTIQTKGINENNEEVVIETIYQVK